MRNELIEEILRARERIYHINKPTLFEKVTLSGVPSDVFLKREDLSSINAYKWRGAYNAISMLDKAQRQNPVIAASAGNHAQGVALACRKLGLKARIYMPQSTPQMKWESVQKHGQDSVEIKLIGDTYDQAAAEALLDSKNNNFPFIHPFDNIYTIAGQATIADEIVLSGQGPFDYAFIQIGGGGLAAGVATWLKIHYPNIKIIGVEGEGQASMKSSLEKGKPVTLNHVDSFCDGTAVKRPGDITFKICKENIDEIITVSNEEVCAAIETMWEARRVIPEPSGALGLAGLIKFSNNNHTSLNNKRLVSIICGANMDFSKLRLISANYAVGAHKKRYVCFQINEQSGSLLGLIEKYFKEVNISAFLYGKVSNDKAWPIIAFEADPEILEKIFSQLDKDKIDYDDITGEPDTRYRIINYNPHLFHNPQFLNVHFPERAGALRDLLKSISSLSNICYFNYEYTGENIGRAIMGFEFETPTHKKDFENIVSNSSISFKTLDSKTFSRITKSG
jgi:threonine dehydratase